MEPPKLTHNQYYDYINVLRSQGRDEDEIFQDLEARGLSEEECNEALYVSAKKMSTSAKSQITTTIIAMVVVLGVLISLQVILFKSKTSYSSYTTPLHILILFIGGVRICWQLMENAEDKK